MGVHRLKLYIIIFSDTALKSQLAFYEVENTLLKSGKKHIAKKNKMEIEYENTIYYFHSCDSCKDINRTIRENTIFYTLFEKDDYKGYSIESNIERWNNIKNATRDIRWRAKEYPFEVLLNFLQKKEEKMIDTTVIEF